MNIPVIIKTGNENVCGILDDIVANTAYVTIGIHSFVVDGSQVVVFGDHIGQKEEEMQEVRYETAFHDIYGTVEILGKCRDIMGNDKFIIRPIDINGYLLSIGASYTTDRCTYGKMDVPIDVFPCELVMLENLNKKIADAMVSTDAVEYQVFYSTPWLDGTYQQARDGKKYRGLGMTTTTSPVAETEEEYVRVVAELPREKVRGDRKSLYYLSIKDKLVTKGEIKIEPVTEPITDNGVTSYKAKVTDTYDTLKRKSNKDWVPVLKSMDLLVIGVDTGRLSIVPSYRLYKTEVPESKEIEIAKYRQKKTLAKNSLTERTMYRLDDAYEKIGIVKRMLNLDVGEDRAFYNCVETMQSLRYQPRKEETCNEIEIMQLFISSVKEELAAVGIKDVSLAKTDSNKGTLTVTSTKGSWDFDVLKTKDKTDISKPGFKIPENVLDILRRYVEVALV